MCFLMVLCLSSFDVIEEPEDWYIEDPYPDEDEQEVSLGLSFDLGIELLDGLDRFNQRYEAVLPLPVVPWYELEPPDILSRFVGYGVGDHSSIAFTGGAFSKFNSNYGVGYFLFPLSVKSDTFGFRKNTSRVINLTDFEVSGYAVFGGVTYPARLVKFGELQYYDGTVTPAVWRSVVISSIEDSNIQFVDETSIRGIENPNFSLAERLSLMLSFIHVLLMVFIFFRSGR